MDSTTAPKHDQVGEDASSGLNHDARKGGHRRLILTVIIGSVLFLGGGVLASYLLGMYFFDRMDFMFSLGVVDLMGCTFYAAWATRNDEEAGAE